MIALLSTVYKTRKRDIVTISCLEALRKGYNALRQTSQERWIIVQSNWASMGIKTSQHSNSSYRFTITKIYDDQSTF